MKNLADDLVVICDEIVDTPESAPINPSDGINYWFIVAVLLVMTYLLLLVIIAVKHNMKRRLTIPCLLSYQHRHKQGKRNQYKSSYILLFRITSRLSFDLSQIKIDEKSFKIVLIYYTVYVTPISIKLLYVIINNANGYIAESNGSNYLTLVPTDVSKDTQKKTWSKIKFPITSTDNNSDDYYDQQMKIKFNFR